MDKLFDRLQMLEDRYEELGELLSDPDVISDTKRFTKLSKEMADLRETVEKYNKYKLWLFLAPYIVTTPQIFYAISKSYSNQKFSY